MTIGVGILGFAHGHVNMYCTQWRKDPDYGIQVLAGWDHNADRLEKAAADFGLTPCVSPEELLARPDIQAVVIASETSLHVDLVEKAAAAGKQIALQKPLALTLAEADRIVDALRRHPVPFTLAWQMRVDPQNLQIKAMLESGQLGKIFMVRRRHGLATHTWANFNQTWHVQPDTNRDIWADDSAHAIDFIHWLLGLPETVTAEVTSQYDPKIPMDNGLAIFRYPDGPLAEVSCSFTCVAAENTVEVFAEKGTIIQNYGDVPSCNVPRPEGAVGQKWYIDGSGAWTSSEIPSPAGHGARISGLSGPLADFFHGKRAPIATAEEGRDTLRMTLACYVSTREGRRVRLDDESIRQV
jgi:predicted dehydrogenase